MAARTYRFGLIGCGGMGRTHAQALVTTPGLALAALAESDDERRTAAGAAFGVAPAHCYPDYATMLEREALDVVIVATQAPQHAAATLAAAARGVHVLCEKPLALDLAEADAMIDACERAGVLLATNHLRRVEPAALHARDLIAAGAIGAVVGVDLHEKGGRPVCNALLEMATHYIDQLRLLLSGVRYADGRRGDEIEWVFARLSAGSGAQAHAARLEEIVPSQVARPTDRDDGLVLGERATIVFGLAGETQAVLRYYDRPVSDTRYDGADVIGVEGSLAVRWSGEHALYRRVGYAWAAHDPWQPAPVPATPPAPAGERQLTTLCRAMALDLIAAIQEQRAPICSGRDGRAALEAALAVYESHRYGRAVALPLAERGHPLVRWQAAVAAGV
jgi:predicted dehydrogenase